MTHIGPPKRSGRIQFVEPFFASPEPPHTKSWERVNAWDRSGSIRTEWFNWRLVPTTPSPDRTAALASFQLLFRDPSGAERQVPLHEPGIEIEVGSLWRKPPNYRNQKNYPGQYWSSTMESLVQFESLLEERFLRTADFGGLSRIIRSQPLQLQGTKDGSQKKYTPDFLIIDRNENVTIVEVKASGSLEKGDTLSTLRWAADAFAERGWAFAVWTDADPIVEANLRYIASARHGRRMSPAALSLLASIAGGRNIGDVMDEVEGQLPSPIVLPHLLHLIWRGTLICDLSSLLQETTVLETRS